MSEFIAGYIEAALWTSSIGEDFAEKHNTETGEDWASDVGMLDFGFTADDLSSEALASVTEDCEAFLAANGADLAQYAEERSYDPSQGSVMSYAGHDFWLTRCGHGAGFWDRGLGALGDRLSDAAKVYGESYLYVSDEGEVEVS